MKTEIKTLRPGDALGGLSCARECHQQMVQASSTVRGDVRPCVYTNCSVFAEGKHIDRMVGQAREVTLADMREHCKAFERWESIFGYGSELPTKDAHLALFKSEFRGRSCYFVVHSAIEWIWALSTGS